MERPAAYPRKRRLLRGLLPALACCIATCSVAEKAPSLPVLYPPSEATIDDRSDYPKALLELALHESGVRFDLHESSLHLPQARALAMLAAGKEISVYWSMTSRQREADLLPVRIPIDKGLLGWRLLLIRNDEQSRFSAITSIEQLRKVAIGQGHDWPDTEILASNGFTVTAVPSYELLFNMLQKGRIDGVPRSIGEIRDEAGVHAADGLTIESSLALHYPAAEYFFVNRDNTALAAALEKGLRTALRDGSFDKLFTLYYAGQIQSARLDRRRVFELPNPLLPPETPLDHPAFWFRPTGAAH